MLKGISKYISPQLLYNLSSMGHGDEIVLADVHFPGESCNENVIRADGINLVPLLDGILPLFPLDTYVDSPITMISPVEGDTLDPNVEKSFRKVIDKYQPEIPPIVRIDRFDFYKRAKEAFAIVMTGETAKYGCIILKKGVILI
jgi:L-fucose mutarotase